jgi:predicted enzyme related to lactoylglutathione lyase
MGEQDRYIPGVPCWVDTTQPDPERAADFYRGVFGWELEDAMPAGSEGRYFMARLRGEDVAAVSSQMPGAGDGPAVWNTYIWVDDADETAAAVRDAGGTVLAEPFDVGDAGRMAVCADREGAAFSLWQAGRHRGARIVNEPGSLNFNVLSTRDPDAAAAFYGAVFGWEVLPVGDGSMWALPAYGDFLERRTPGMRERMAEMGAPERFEEVVASLDRIADDQPAHWGVTFGTDDADAVAAKAAELGGTVVVAPFDAPWTRMTVITDPQGATFVASKFVPENRDLDQAASSTSAAE